MSCLNIVSGEGKYLHDQSGHGSGVIMPYWAYFGDLQGAVAKRAQEKECKDALDDGASSVDERGIDTVVGCFGSLCHG